MCGIACVLHDDPQQPVDPALLKRMSDRIAHRGPDAEGFHFDPPVGLASRRLAIIDLQTGQQPIADEENRIWVVFNGEIYNFAALREELQKRGHAFKTLSDTETLVHLYQEYGDELVHHLRGMFAFALWDSGRRRLLLARDRIGKKPLFYARTSGAFIAASELKALLAFPGLDTSVDLEALDLYLTYQSVPAPHTIYRGVRKLPPAHLMVVEGGRVQTRRYWSVPTREPLRIDETECREEILRLLREAVRLRMVSDVPLGAFLSGGIDSSLVVALMQEASTRPVKTFSIGFPEEDHSELPHARLVARHLGTDHQEFIVRPDALGVLPRLVRAYDEPFADNSCVPTFYVSQETRRHVTVALNGDGGDEAFGGYLRYRPQVLYRCVDRLPPGTLALLRAAVRFTPPLERRSTFMRRAAAFIRRASLPDFERYVHTLVYFTQQQKQPLYTVDLQRAVDRSDPIRLVRAPFERPGMPTLLDRMLATDLETYLPDTLLVKMDIASMANSLETRSPFLDHVLVEFAARVPAHLKLHGLTLKYILRRCGEKLLPAPILRRGKQGFGLPIQHWVRHDLRPFITDTLLSSRAAGRGYFRPEAVRAILEEHWRGGQHGVQIWALLMLELWQRIFVDHEPL